MTGSIRAGSWFLTRKPRALVRSDVTSFTSTAGSPRQPAERLRGATPSRPYRNREIGRQRSDTQACRPQIAIRYRASRSYHRVATAAVARSPQWAANCISGKKLRGKFSCFINHLWFESAIWHTAPACSRLSVAIAHHSVAWASRMGTDAGPAFPDEMPRLSPLRAWLPPGHDPRRTRQCVTSDLGSRRDERRYDIVQRTHPPASMACRGSGHVCRGEFRCASHGILPESSQSS